MMAGVVDQDPESLLKRLAAVESAAPLLRRLSGSEQDVYMVGGAVRDLMRGGQPVDLDLVVDGPLEPLAAQIGAPLHGHDRFGTGSVELEGHRYDLARTRTETYAHPGALPTVGAGNLHQDLARRDFTVNAIVLGVAGPDRGRLEAFGTGLEDVAKGRLRVLHDASFRDDPTRLLRLARYHSRLGFEIEPQTSRLAKEAIDGGALATVSGARLGSEVWLLATEDDPVRAFGALTELGLGEALGRGFGLSGRGVRVARRGLDLLPGDGRPAVLVVAAAALGLPEAERVELLGRLALPAAERDAILEAAHAPDLAERMSAAGRASEIARAVGGARVEAVALAGSLGPMRTARRWLEDLRHVALEITGADLLRAGVPGGPAVGRGLRAALAAKLDGRANGWESELDAALAAAQGPGEEPLV